MKNIKWRKNKKVPSVKGHPPTGVARSSGKPLLSSSAYQIFAVVMISGSLMAQAPDVSQQYKCVGGAIGPSRGWAPSYTPPPGPSPADIAAQQQRNEAYNLNQQGLQYWRNKQWKLAAEAFRSALQKSPNDPVIQQNLVHAETAIINEQGVDYYNNGNWKLAAQTFKAALEKWPDNEIIQDSYRKASSNLAAEEAEQKQKQQEANAADNMRRLLLKSADEIGAGQAASSGGLDFVRPGGPPLKDALNDNNSQASGGRTIDGSVAGGGLDFMKAGSNGNPTPPTASEALALWKSHNLDAAEQAYRKLVENSSANPESAALLRLLLAQVLFAKGDYAGAAKELNEAARVTPDSPLLRAVQATIVADPAGAKALADLQQKQGAATATAGGTDAAKPGTLSPFPTEPGKVQSSVIGGPTIEKTKDNAYKEFHDYTVTPPPISGKHPQLPKWAEDHPELMKNPAMIGEQKKLDHLTEVRDEAAGNLETIHQKWESTKDPNEKSKILADGVKQMEAWKKAKQDVQDQKEKTDKLAKRLIDSSREGSPGDGNREPAAPTAPPSGSGNQDNKQGQ